MRLLLTLSNQVLRFAHVCISSTHPRLWSLIALPWTLPPSTDWLIALLLHARYKILAPAETDRILAKDAENMKGVADAILDSVKLNPESFRLGHTKACTLSRAHTCRKQLIYIQQNNTTLTISLYLLGLYKRY